MKKTLLMALIAGAFHIAHSQVPQTLSYQGILVQTSGPNAGQPVADGTHYVRFRFYTTPTGGTPVYSSLGTGSGNVVTTFKGMFSFIIGSGTPGNDPIPASIFSNQLYVEIEADGTTLTPRIPLTTTPYAFVAQTANTMDAANLTGTLNPARIAAGAIDNTKLADNAVTSAKIADGTIATADIANASVTTLKLADDAVTSAKIANGTVATADIADAAITTLKLADDAVTSAKIANGTVATADIADAAVTTLKLADNTVTSAKIADGTIATADIADAAITTLKLADDAVTSAKIANGTVATADIADAAVTNLKMADNAITSAKIADGTIATADIADGAITTLKLANDNVTTAKIADAAVTNLKMADNAITSPKIVDGTITTADIADGAITAAKLAPGATLSGGGADTRVAFWSGATSLTFSNNLVFDGNSLGIGTLNPLGRLHVNNSDWGSGSALISAGFPISAGAAIRFTSPASGAKTYDIIGSTGDGASMGAGAFGIWDNTGGAYRLVISSAGNVGIGTHLPSSKLHVVGNVQISGNLTKGSGTFKIDHPLYPETKYLSHSFVESPDMMNVYNGNITTDAEGLATVQLPDYFEALNKDFRYQLTVIGTFAQAIVLKEISNNQFTIQTDKPGVKVSWQVTGIRNDPYARKNPVIPEEDKKPEDVGKYLHPEAYGLPPERGIGTQSEGKAKNNFSGQQQ
jgi:hypothetical protein